MPAIPLIWIISAVIGGLSILLLGIKNSKHLKNLFRNPSKNKLGILGMPKAGKTRFLSYLKGIPYVEKETPLYEKYDSFIFKTKNGREIHIESGYDIDGDDLNRIDYNSIMEKSDVVFYFFDINKYFQDEKYKRNCNSRLLYLNNSFDENSKKDLMLFATHTDKCLVDNNKIIKIFKDMLQDKSYKNLISKTNFINLTDKKELDEINELIFEKK